MSSKVREVRFETDVIGMSNIVIRTNPAFDPDTYTNRYVTRISVTHQDQDSPLSFYIWTDECPVLDIVQTK